MESSRKRVEIHAQVCRRCGEYVTGVTPRKTCPRCFGKLEDMNLYGYAMVKRDRAERQAVQPKRVNPVNPDQAIELAPPVFLILSPDGNLTRHWNQTCIIGRGSECQKIVRNPLVSRKHVVLEKQGKSYYITDLHSENGSYLNGKRLQPGVRTPLPDGSVLLLGSDDKYLAVRYRVFHATAKHRSR